MGNRGRKRKAPGDNDKRRKRLPTSNLTRQTRAQARALQALLNPAALSAPPVPNNNADDGHTAPDGSNVQRPLATPLANSPPARPARAAASATTASTAEPRTRVTVSTVPPRTTDARASPSAASDALLQPATTPTCLPSQPCQQSTAHPMPTIAATSASIPPAAGQPAAPTRRLPMDTSPHAVIVGATPPSSGPPGGSYSQVRGALNMPTLPLALHQPTCPCSMAAPPQSSGTPGAPPPPGPALLQGQAAASGSSTTGQPGLPHVSPSMSGEYNILGANPDPISQATAGPQTPLSVTPTPQALQASNTTSPIDLGGGPCYQSVNLLGSRFLLGSGKKLSNVSL